MTAAYDLLPTLLDIARASRRPRELVGQSLVQQASRKAWNDQRAFTWTSNDSPGCVAIRQGEWFATRDRVDGPFRLYQSTVDPECEKDVAETHPEVVKRLQDLAAETPAADVSRASR